MASQLDATSDVSVKTTDNASGASAMICEVNSDRAAKPADTKPQDQSLVEKVSSFLGNLSLTSDSSKDSATVNAADTTTVSPKAANTTAVSAKTADTKTAEKPADTSSAPGDGKRDVASQPNAAEVDHDALKAIAHSKDLQAAYKALDDDITKHEKGLSKGSDEYQRLETMRVNMEIFERRASAEHPPLKPEEITRTFKGIMHIMDAKDGANVLPQGDRMDVAQQALLHAADPTTIDQGNHKTCNVSTVETRMFAKNPAAAVALLDQVATTGEFRTVGEPSHTIKINPDSLKRSGPEEKKAVPEDGERSYASQIFQVTTVNAIYGTQEYHGTDEFGDPVRYATGAVEYRQGKPDENATPPTNGEMLFNKVTGQPIKDGDGKIVDSPDMDDHQIVDAYNLIADHKDSDFYLLHKSAVVGDGKELTQFNSESELKTRIEEAQKNGKLPVILGVYSNQEPFFSDSGAGAAGGSGAAHVVTITGIDRDGKVQIENQWGKDSKHSVDMHELYVATIDPKDSIAVIAKDCAKNAKDGKVDYSMEAELLRLRHTKGDLKGQDWEYRQQLVWLTKQAVADAGQNRGGVLDPRTENELHKMLKIEKAKGGENWSYIEGKIWDAPIRGILDGSGSVGGSRMIPEYKTYQMQQEAKDLFDAGDQTIYFSDSDYAKMDRALQYKSPAEIQQMDKEFQKEYGKSMEDYINDRFKRHPEERDKALKLLHQAQAGDQPAA